MKEKESIKDLIALIVKATLKRWRLVLTIGIIVLVGNVIAGVFFNLIDAVYHGKIVLENIVKLTIMHFAVIGAVPVIVGCLLLEAHFVGWKRSSLYQVLVEDTPSNRTDIVYSTLYCANLLPVLGFIFSLGLGYYISALIHQYFEFTLLRDQSILIGFSVQWLVGPLVMYFVHRIQHTRFLWEFHKVHHAAEEMTMINNFRNHPYDVPIRTVFESMPGAILGIHPIAMILYVLSAGIVVLWQHSNYDWRQHWIEKYIFIGSRGHRIHHSKAVEHFNCNLGFVVFWDWLFRTLYTGETPVDLHEIQIGVENSPVHNKGNPFQEMLIVMTSGLSTLVRELFVGQEHHSHYESHDADNV